MYRHVYINICVYSIRVCRYYTHMYVYTTLRWCYLSVRDSGGLISYGDRPYLYCWFELGIVQLLNCLTPL